MNGQRIGCVRVSRFDQNPERQVVVQACGTLDMRTTACCSTCRHWAGSTSTWRETTAGSRTSKSNRATSAPYRRSISLSVRFFPFRWC